MKRSRLAVLAAAAIIASLAVAPAANANGRHGGHGGHVGGHGGHVGGPVGGYHGPVGGHRGPVYVAPRHHGGAGRWVGPALGGLALGLALENYAHRGHGCCYGGYQSYPYPVYRSGPPIIIEESPIYIERPPVYVEPPVVVNPGPVYEEHPSFVRAIPVDHWDGARYVRIEREVTVRWDYDNARYFYVLDGVKYWW